MSRPGLLRRWRQALALTAASIPLPALAHGPVEGIGAFYAGLLHPLMVPSHALALVLLGLLLGQAGMAAMRRGYSGFLPGLLAGLGLAAFSLHMAVDLPLLVLASVSGLLVVCQWRLPLGTLYLLAGGAIGLLVGIDSGPDGGSPGQRLGALLGTGLGAFACLLLVGDLSERARRHWQRVLLRVLGSWGAAAALLVLALGQLRPG